MKRNLYRQYFGLVSGFSMALLLTQSGTAQALIQVGSRTLLPDRSDQVLEFSVSNLSESIGIAVQSFEFNLQVGDGGVAVGGTSVGPRITGVDLLTGSIFEGNNSGMFDASGSPQVDHPLLGIYSTLTASGTTTLAAAQSRTIALVTFDTTGLTSGSWSLALKSTVNGPTKFVNLGIPGDDGNGNLFPQIVDGNLSIIVVPEPDGVLCVGLVLLGFAIHSRRHRQKFSTTSGT